MFTNYRYCGLLTSSAQSSEGPPVKRAIFLRAIKAVENCLGILHRAKLTSDEKLWAASTMVGVLQATGASQKRKKPA
jgi:hypothetical protein